jgi:hypothetical protein
MRKPRDHVSAMHLTAVANETEHGLECVPGAYFVDMSSAWKDSVFSGITEIMLTP